MPTYEDMRSFFDSSEELRSLVTQISKNPLVQGFTLTLNPVWALFYDLEHGFVREDSAPIDDIERWHRANWRHFITSWPPYVAFFNRYQGYRRRDLNAPVKRWEAMTNPHGKAEPPLYLTIVHRPLREPDENTMRQTDGLSDIALLERLNRAVGEAQVAVELEERRPAQLAAAPGSQINVLPSSSGTVGGFLRDSASGKVFGVTCSHVVSTGQSVLDATSSLIGVCAHDTARVPLATGTVCDPVTLAVPAPSPGNGPDVNMLDCALIDVSGPISGGTITGAPSTLTPGQNVYMEGATTKRTNHKLGSLCLSYEFKFAGKSYCFRDSIQLVPQPWGPLGGPLGGLMTTVPRQGDSGAWVLTDDTPPRWAAVFFGEDGTHGYAIRSSWVKAWADGATGSTLVT